MRIYTETFSPDYAYLKFDKTDPADITKAIIALSETLTSLPKKSYVDVLFPGAIQTWRYFVPAGLDSSIRVGSFVTVQSGVYRDWVGRVQAITHTPPPAPYVYNVKRVVQF